MEKKPVILIVEDDEATLKMYKQIFDTAGFVVFEAIDGKKAVNLAVEKKPDVILLDLLLPIMDGISVIKNIRDISEVKNTPIVAVTSMDIESAKNSFDISLVTDLLSKIEYSPLAILEKVRKLL
ncbi:response regulator [Patescibacteria group bacterium]|nr:response regulator [Patescibacteria group bacterium]